MKNGARHFSESQGKRMGNKRLPNDRRRSGRPPGRPDVALLAGLVVCGRCNAVMRVASRPRQRYVCASSQCAANARSVHAAQLERMLATAVLAAFAPAGLERLVQLANAQQAEFFRTAQRHRSAVVHAEHAAHQAEQRYRSIDPVDRATLTYAEQQWQAALRTLAEARAAAEHYEKHEDGLQLDNSMSQRLRLIGSTLPRLWHSQYFLPGQKQSMLRELIRYVVIADQTPTSTLVKVVWATGAITTNTLD
jgi:hypothetical protein